MAENSRLALMILTGWLHFDAIAKLRSTRLRSRTFLRNHPLKSVFRRDAETRRQACATYCSWRNQRSAMEVWASLTSWPPWKVPIRIR